MSKLSFRARALDPSKPLNIHIAEELPDLTEYSAINRAVPQMPSGMEKEEESEHHLQRAICTGLIIPTPEVFDIDAEFYDRSYPENFKVTRQLIRMQPLGIEQDIPDYDMDSADEAWVNSQSRRFDLTPLKFEEMMDRLEKSSGQTVVTLNEAKTLLKQDDELSIAVYDYWLNKRLTTQHPLILTVRTENRAGATVNNPYIAFRRRTEKMQTRKNRKNDETSYEKMLKLRRNLSRAVTILELIKRREKTKREHVHLGIEIFEKRYQAKDFSGHLLAEFTNNAVKSARAAFAPLYGNQYSSQQSNQSWPNSQYHSMASGNNGAPGLTSALLNNKRASGDIDAVLLNNNRKEKRQYKKRKHKSQRDKLPYSTPGHAADQIASSDEEEPVINNNHLGHETEDEGMFPFRRSASQQYHRPLIHDFGNWPWESRKENGMSDPKYRFTLTSIRHPRPRCVGFARRRRGRGGRIVLDRVSTNMDEFWANLDYTIYDSSKIVTTKSSSPWHRLQQHAQQHQADDQTKASVKVEYDSSSVVIDLVTNVNNSTEKNRLHHQFGRELSSERGVDRTKSVSDRECIVIKTEQKPITEFDNCLENTNRNRSSASVASMPSAGSDSFEKLTQLRRTTSQGIHLNSSNNLIGNNNDYRDSRHFKSDDGGDDEEKRKRISVDKANDNTNTFYGVVSEHNAERSHERASDSNRDGYSRTDDKDSAHDERADNATSSNRVNENADSKNLSKSTVKVDNDTDSNDNNNNNDNNDINPNRNNRNQNNNESYTYNNSNLNSNDSNYDGNDTQFHSIRNNGNRSAATVKIDRDLIDNGSSSSFNSRANYTVYSQHDRVPGSSASPSRHFSSVSHGGLVSSDRSYKNSSSYVKDARSSFNQAHTTDDDNGDSPLYSELFGDWLHFRPKTPDDDFDVYGQFGDDLPQYAENSSLAIEVQRLVEDQNVDSSELTAPAVVNSTLPESFLNDQSGNVFHTKPFSLTDLPTEESTSGSTQNSIGSVANLSGDNLHELNLSLGEHEDNEKILDNLLEECQFDDLKVFNPNANFWNGLLDDTGGLLDVIDDKKAAEKASAETEGSATGGPSTAVHDERRAQKRKTALRQQRIGHSVFQVSNLHNESFFKKNKTGTKAADSAKPAVVVDNANKQSATTIVEGNKETNAAVAIKKEGDCAENAEAEGVTDATIKVEPNDELMPSSSVADEQAVIMKPQIFPVIKTEMMNNLSVMQNAVIQRPITIQQSGNLQQQTHQGHAGDQTLILSRPIRRITTNGPSDGKANVQHLLINRKFQMVQQRSSTDDDKDVKPKIIEGSYLKIPAEFNIVSSIHPTTMSASVVTSKHNYSLPPQAAFHHQPITLIGQSPQMSNKVIVNQSPSGPTNLAIATSMQDMQNKITLPTSNIKLNLIPSLAQVMQSGGGLLIDAKSLTSTSGDHKTTILTTAAATTMATSATASSATTPSTQIHYQQHAVTSAQQQSSPQHHQKISLQQQIPQKKSINLEKTVNMMYDADRNRILYTNLKNNRSGAQFLAQINPTKVVNILPIQHKSNMTGTVQGLVAPPGSLNKNVQRIVASSSQSQAQLATLRQAVATTATMLTSNASGQPSTSAASANAQTNILGTGTIIGTAVGSASINDSQVTTNNSNAISNTTNDNVVGSATDNLTISDIR